MLVGGFIIDDCMVQTMARNQTVAKMENDIWRHMACASARSCAALHKIRHALGALRDEQHAGCLPPSHMFLCMTFQ